MARARTRIPPIVRPFMPEMQVEIVESSDEFKHIMLNLMEQISRVPALYATENVDLDDKIIHLHYFYGGSDWYIAEASLQDGQLMAFGYAIINGDMQNAEWGYISIDEIKSTNKVELDFHWTPVKFKDIPGIERVDPYEFADETGRYPMEGEVERLHEMGKLGSRQTKSPEDTVEIQYKVPLEVADAFTEDMRRAGYDVGTDADYLGDTSKYMTVQVRAKRKERTNIERIVAKYTGALMSSVERIEVGENDIGTSMQKNPGGSDMYILQMSPQAYRERIKEQARAGESEINKMTPDEAFTESYVDQINAAKTAEELFRIKREMGESFQKGDLSVDDWNMLDREIQANLKRVR